MFTGIVQEIGRVRQIDRSARGASLWIDCTMEALQLGESVAVDGVCLTADEVRDGGFRADASAETLARTTLGERRAGDRLHLERALRLGDRVGGHLVTGHVDAVGRIVERTPLGAARKVAFEVPEPLAALIAPKGSVAVDGVSLTTNGVWGARFDVVLVPHTLGATRLGESGPGAAVNVEVDVLAKYVARLVSTRPNEGGVAGSDISVELLREKGFL